MYADRYERKTRFNPSSFGLALMINGAIMAGLIYSVPDFVKQGETHLIARAIPLPKDPPPLEQPKPKPQDVKLKSTPAVPPLIPQQIVQTYKPSEVTFVSPPSIPTLPEGTGGTGIVVPPVKPPIVLGPELDARFAGSFQPNYPATERRAEHEGRVVVRVLVGVDGRVKQVERVSAASEAFFDATRERALEKWRFKPATRDGVPIEAWRSVGVSFVLSGTD